MVLAEAGRYTEAERALGRSIEMRPNQYRAWGLLAAVHANQHADAAKVRDTYLKAIALAARPAEADAEGRIPPGRRRRLLRGASGKEKESLPLLAQAAALAPDIPEVLYQVAVGYEMLHHRDEALRWLAKARASGYPSDAIARNPMLTALRADPGTAQRPRQVADHSTHQERISMTNPNIDRASPAQEEDRQEEEDLEEVVSRASGGRVYNCLESHDQHQDWSLQKAKALGLSARKKKIPAAKDLRESWWNIGNQGSTGSCVGWALADSVLRYHFVKSGKLRKHEHISVRYIWMAAKEMDHKCHVSDDVPR